MGEGCPGRARLQAQGARWGSTTTCVGRETLERRAGGSPSQGASNSSMPSKNHLGAYKNADSPSQGVGLGNARVWNVHSCLDEYWSVGQPRWFPPGSPCSKQRLSFPGFLERKGQEKVWQRTRLGLEQNGKVCKGCLSAPLGPASIVRPSCRVGERH